MFLLLRGLLLGLCTLTEPVLESAGHGLHVPHPTSADSLPSLSLLGPVKFSTLCIGVSAAGAHLLLDVVAVMG